MMRLWQNHSSVLTRRCKWLFPLPLGQPCCTNLRQEMVSKMQEVRGLTKRTVLMSTGYPLFVASRLHACMQVLSESTEKAE